MVRAKKEKTNGGSLPADYDPSSKAAQKIVAGRLGVSVAWLKKKLPQIGKIPPRKVS